jgi:hypothetical protein
MGKDIFNTDIEYGSSWKMDGPVLTVGGGKDTYELVVSQISLQYGRPVQRYIPLNSNKITMMTGRGSGTANLGIIVGPKDALSRFIKDFSDACKTEDNILTIAPTDPQFCKDKAVSKFVCNYCLLNNITVQASTGNDLAVVSGGLAMVIGMLGYESVGG